MSELQTKLATMCAKHAGDYACSAADVLSESLCHELYCKTISTLDPQQLAELADQIAALTPLTPEWVAGQTAHIDAIIPATIPSGPTHSKYGYLASWQAAAIAEKCRKEQRRAKSALAAIQADGVISPVHAARLSDHINRADALAKKTAVVAAGSPIGLVLAAGPLCWLDLLPLGWLCAMLAVLLATLIYIVYTNSELFTVPVLESFSRTMPAT